MSEKALWAVVRNHLQPYGIVKRLEDRLTSGTPDVLYCLRAGPGAPAATGWIELKRLVSWPVRSTTIVRIPAHSGLQASFLLSWQQAGGRGWMLLQIARDYLLLDPAAAIKLTAGQCTAASLVASAAVHEQGSFPALKILKRLVG